MEQSLCLFQKRRRWCPNQNVPKPKCFLARSFLKSNKQDLLPVNHPIKTDQQKQNVRRPQKTDYNESSSSSPSSATKKRKLCDVNFFFDGDGEGDETCAVDKGDNKSKRVNTAATYNGDKRKRATTHNVDNDSSNSGITKSSNSNKNNKDLKNKENSTQQQQLDQPVRKKEKINLAKLSKVPVLGRGVHNKKIDFEEHEDFLSYDKYTGAEDVGPSQLSLGNDKRLAETLGKQSASSAKRNITQNPSRAKVRVSKVHHFSLLMHFPLTSSLWFPTIGLESDCVFAEQLKSAWILLQFIRCAKMVNVNT